MPNDNDIKPKSSSKYKTVPLADYVKRTTELYDPYFNTLFPQDKFQELDKTNEDFANKYGQFAKNRFWWGDAVNKNVPSENKPLGDIILNVANKQGVNPKFLLGSAFEEGIFKSLYGKDYLNVAGTPDPNYKFSGMALLGLDTFSERYPELKKYLPEDFKFVESQAPNNKGEVKRSAVFKTPSDALVAMTAFLKSNKDEVEGIEKKKGIKLSDKAKDFFTMAAYNGGIGNAEKMLDYYQAKGELKNDRFLMDDDLALDKYGGIYQNVRRRIDAVNALEKEGKLDFSPERIAKAEKGMWTTNLSGYSKKVGDFNVISPTDKKIPFDVVIAGDQKKIVPRGTDVSKVDVNSLPVLDTYDYDANINALNSTSK